MTILEINLINTEALDIPVNIGALQASYNLTRQLSIDLPRLSRARFQGTDKQISGDVAHPDFYDSTPSNRFLAKLRLQK